MANNRKMRKFEGTCYIPGEQLAMMAKYYRGANLNLNLTLVEDDMGVMQESLENSCWCSKLDEVDRMKFQHMKGDAWRINHDHHLQGSDLVDLRSGNCCFSPVKFSKEMKGGPETRVDKGTDTISLYNQSPRRDYYDPRYDAGKIPPPMRDNYYGDRNFRRSEGPRRGFLPSQDVGYHRPDHNTHTYPVTHSQSPDSENRYRRNLDNEMEDDTRWASEKSEDDIKCVVCKKDACAVCKNPLRGRPCHCKCVIPNAGLCNECDMQCEKESDKEDGVSKGQEQTQTNFTNLMLMLMSSQMLNRPQNTEPSCKCDVRSSKPVSVCDSDSASGSTSCSCCTEKVQKIFLYNCDSSGKSKEEEAKKSKKKVKKPSSAEDSSTSSKNCDCCKCSKKENKQIKSTDNTQNKSSNPQVKKNSNESKRSEKSKQSYSSQNTSMKGSGMPIKGTKPNATSNKDDPSDKGKKKGVRRSWFRQPLEDNINQSSSGKKDKNNKRRRLEERTDSDNGSQTSRQSDRDIDRKKSPLSSSVDLKDFLICLPKIKSDLEQLLVRVQGDDRKQQMQQKAPHLSVPVTQPYFTNVRVRSTVPFITHPAANALLSAGPLNHGTTPSFKFHPKPNFDYGVVQNHHLPPQWDEFNRFDQGVSHRRHIDTVYPMEQQYRCIFSSLPTDEIVSETRAKPQNNTRGECGLNNHFSSSRQQTDIRLNVTGNTFRPTYKHPIFEKSSIHQEFQTSNNLWKCHQRNSADTSIEETFNLTNADPSRQQNALHSYNQENTSEFIDQRFVNHHSLIPQELSNPAKEESKIARLKKEMDSTNKRAANRIDDNQDRMQIEGSNQIDQKGRSDKDVVSEEGSSKNACCNAVVMCKGINTFKENPSNEPVQPVQSSDSKHTSDQFISAVEVNEQLSEDTFLQEGEHKQTFGKLDQQVNEECEGQRTSRSIGPGQFRVTKSNAPGFNLPKGSPENIKHSHTQNKRKRHVHDEVVTQVCSTEEGQTNAHRVIVKNCSFASTGGHDFIKSSVQSLDVIISEEKASKKCSSNGDRLGFTVQPHESVVALSETRVKTTNSHDVVLSNMELTALSPALKGDAQYYNIIDQIKSTSAVFDNSRDSFQCGLAHSSLPSSEEDVNLPQLPTESTELIADKGKKYCKRAVLDQNISRALDINDTRSFNFSVHAENELEKPRLVYGKDIAGGIRHRTALQAAKFKLAQEAIQSMVQNVNEILASIDSDSESKIDATSSNHQDRERQTFFVHLGRDESMNKLPQDNALSKIQNTIRDVCYDQSATRPLTSKTGDFRDTTNRFDDEYISGVTDHIGSPQSLQSFSSNELNLREGNSRTPTSLNAATKAVSRERNYFVLDSSRSNSSVFTERLRRSLAQETSSPNLSAVLTPEEHTSSGNLKRTCSPKPLKRRSWIPPPE